MNEKYTKKSNPAQKSILSELMGIDQQILRLLLKRYNLLGKIRKGGKMDSAEEKTLREAWQNGAAKVSKDPDLSGKFFSLLQNISFLPKSDASDTPGQTVKRETFNILPLATRVDISLAPPVDSRAIRAWAFMAACAGKPARLEPSAQSDPVVDCVKAFNQMGGSISCEGSAIIVKPDTPMQAPDKVIHVGDSVFNFYLCLAHYLGRPSHAKFTGNTSLKLADLSFLDKFLPGLGARLIHIVPKTTGLPVRVECSGLLPPSIRYEAHMPTDFAEALILASVFYMQPFGIDLSAHPEKENILARAVPVLEKCSATFIIDNFSINIEPGSLYIPENPRLPLDMDIAFFLLAFTQPRGGSAKLEGLPPQYEWDNNLWNLLASAQLDLKKSSQELICKAPKKIENFKPGLIQDNSADLPPVTAPLVTSLAVCATLNGGVGQIPQFYAHEETVQDFIRCIGIEMDASGILTGRMEKRDATLPWTAPSPQWAMALALAASAANGKSRGFQLVNPMIVTRLWPAFWKFYNGLTKPAAAEPVEETTRRRRIHTASAASLPPPREED